MKSDVRVVGSRNRNKQLRLLDPQVGNKTNKNRSIVITSNFIIIKLSFHSLNLCSDLISLKTL